MASRRPTNQIESVTPAKARDWLSNNNHNNRPIRTAHVENLARMMGAGDWTITHQGIAFDVTGRLVDGQHRLHAIVMSNKPIEMYVARDLPEGSYRNIDGGAQRLTSDRIRLLSSPRENLFACAIIKFYLGRVAWVGGKARVPSVDEIENEFLEHTDAYSGVARLWVTPVRGITNAPVGAAIACYWTQNPNLAREFAEAVISGANLPENSPAFALRAALLGNRTKSDAQAYWKAISALRAMHNRRTITKLVPATDDFRGNRYKTRFYELKESRTQAAATRAENRKQSAG